jgi:hypothetical protein
MIMNAVVKVLPAVMLFLSPGVNSAELPFSGPADIAFANTLSDALEANNLIGSNRFQGMP